MGAVRRKRGPNALRKSAPKSLVARHGTVTFEQHARAYRMWIVGVDPRDIQREVGLTGKQWHWLFEKGDPNIGMPSLRSQWLDEVESIRSHAVEAGREMSKRSVDVIRRRLKNAEGAGMIINRILALMASDLEGVEGRRWEDYMPTSAVRDTIKALAPLADIKGIADAYKTIFGEAPSVRVARPQMDGSGRYAGDSAADPLGRLEDKRSGAGVSSEVLDGFIADWEAWTDEQKQRFLDTGEEPDPKDIGEDEPED